MRFSYYTHDVRVHESALKHGVDPKDSIFAARHYLVTVDLEEGKPGRQLRLGFDQNGQLIETVVLTFDDTHNLIIHAMKARKRYLNLLPEGSK